MRLLASAQRSFRPAILEDAGADPCPRRWQIWQPLPGHGEWTMEVSGTLGRACSQLNVLVLSYRGPLTNVP